MNLLFDIGGTTTRIAYHSKGITFDETLHVPTPESFSEAIELFENFASKGKISKAAGGFPGNFDKNENISHAPNLPLWVGKPLKSELEKLLKCEVQLYNDAALGGLGEAVFGAGRGYEIVAYMTISTGVGGARIVKGKIDSNNLGFEPGHQIINCEGEPIRTLQSIISGKSIEEETGILPSEIEDKNFWNEKMKIAAYGINNLIVFWSPDIVVIGGGVGTSQNFDIEKIKEELNKIPLIFKEKPILKKAELGTFSGLYGALVNLK